VLITRRALLLFQMRRERVTEAQAERVCRELRRSHKEWIELRNGAGRTLHAQEVPAFRRMEEKWRAFRKFWRGVYSDC